MIILEKQNIYSLFEKRNSESNKGTYGTSALICGSYSMAGAAIICARACTLSGVGIAKVVCPKSIYPIVASCVPEAVYVPLDDCFDINVVESLINSCNSIALGCGMGINEFTMEMLNFVLKKSSVPIVIDADGINCLSKNISLIDKASCPIILTPHPGEFSRISGISISEIQKSREKLAKDFAKKHNIILVLKGNKTVITDGNEVFVNSTGNAGMATGGSGDMLTGIIASLISQGLSPIDAAKAGVYIHGLAGDKSAKKYSMHSTIPEKMLEMLPNIFLEIENQ